MQERVRLPLAGAAPLLSISFFLQLSVFLSSPSLLYIPTLLTLFSYPLLAFIPSYLPLYLSFPFSPSYLSVALSPLHLFSIHFSLLPVLSSRSCPSLPPLHSLTSPFFPSINRPSNTIYERVTTRHFPPHTAHLVYLPSGLSGKRRSNVDGAAKMQVKGK